MISLPAAMGRAVSQLSDPAILKVLVKSVAITLGILVALGIAAGTGVEALISAYRYDFGAEIGAIVAVLLTVVGGWLLFRVIALAVVQFFGDEIVKAVETKHYPDALATARTLTFREELGASVKATARTIGFNLLALVAAIPLIVTGVGPAIVFFLVNAWLLGRELQELAWTRHRHDPAAPAPIARFERLALGATIAGLLVIPVINLLAPVIGAATACHLVHRKKEAARAAPANAA